MRLFSPAAYVSVDYQKKSGAVITKTANEKQLALVRKELAEGRITDLMQVNYQDYVSYEDLVVEESEPVRAELENFQAAIRSRGIGENLPEVTGEDGMTAVDIALKITGKLHFKAQNGKASSRSDATLPTNLILIR